jgi:hypothetical protein
MHGSLFQFMAGELRVTISGWLPGGWNQDLGANGTAIGLVLRVEAREVRGCDEWLASACEDSGRRLNCDVQHWAIIAVVQGGGRSEVEVAKGRVL